MIYRPAINSDKEQIFDFCNNTFEWGDYIQEVWDCWINEKDSLLLVAQTMDSISYANKIVAMIHGKLCHKNMIWVEGIRVHPEYREKGIASSLIKNILTYGKDKGTTLASLIVSIDNIESRKLMEKLDFNPVSRWIFASIKGLKNIYEYCHIIKRAEIKDQERIYNYLTGSKYTRYVKAWRWYILTSHALFRMINNGQIYFFDDQNIRGIVIMDITDFWNGQDNYRIVYLDGDSKEMVSSMLEYCISFFYNYNNYYSQRDKKEQKNRFETKENRNERVQIFCPDTDFNFSVLSDQKKEYFTKLILYDKEI